MSTRFAAPWGLRVFASGHSRDVLALCMATAVSIGYVTKGIAQIVWPETGSYDFQVYLQAARDLSHGADPYIHTLHCCEGVFATPGGYTYPPLMAELIRPLASLSLVQATRVWLIISQLAIAGGIYLVWCLVRHRITVTAQATLLVATLLFDPLASTIDLRQVNAVLVFVFALAAYGYARQRSAIAAGVVIAFGGVIKLLPALLVVAFLRWDRRLRVLPGLTAFVVVAATLVLAMWLATPYTGEFFSAVLPKLAAGSAVYLNQSMSGVSLRLQVLLFGDARPPLQAITALLSLCLLGFTWWLGRTRDDEPGRIAVFASLLALVPIVSTITWNHHLLAEMLVFGLAAPLLAPWTLRWWMAVVAYPLLWLPHSFGILGFAGLHLPPALVVMLGGSLPAVGTVLLWAACCLCLRPRVLDAAEPTDLRKL